MVTFPALVLSDDPDGRLLEKVNPPGVLKTGGAFQASPSYSAASLAWTVTYIRSLAFFWNSTVPVVVANSV